MPVVKPSIPAELRFPPPPFRLDRTLREAPPAEEAVATYLYEIQVWRERVLDFVSSPAAHAAWRGVYDQHLVRATLYLLLQTTWPEAARRSLQGMPYNVGPFPSRAVGQGTRGGLRTLLEVMNWRAAFVDYIADVWDAPQAPALSVEACSAIMRFLKPASTRKLCPLCLTGFPEDRVHPDDHDCIFLEYAQAKWPRPPYTRARRGRDAKVREPRETAPVTPERFLAAYPVRVRRLAARLRRLMRSALPDVAEAVYPGWKLIGYRRGGYIGFIAPFKDHVRLGFEQGVELWDPQGLLEGSGGQVRYVRLSPGADVPADELKAFILEAAALAEKRHARQRRGLAG